MKIFRCSVLAALAAVGLAACAAECNPEIVRKDVKVVRREIVVSVIGEPLAPISLAKGAKDRVQVMIDYWTAAMDKEIGARPDLVVLPEISDTWTGCSHADRLVWLRERGDRILNAWKAYAARHRCYLVYPTYRDRGDGTFSNCCFLLDRDGDAIAVYDKFQPTVRDLGNTDMTVIPGEKAVVATTDFGTVGFLICFDVNYSEIQDLYAPLKPDVLVFPSYCDGGIYRQHWAIRCQSYFIAATVGRIDKSIVGPSGETLIDTIRPRRTPEFHTFSFRINTNSRTCFLDFNEKQINAAKKKYGGDLQIRSGGRDELITLISENPEKPIDDIIAEFGIETWTAYYARSVKARVDRLKAYKQTK